MTLEEIGRNEEGAEDFLLDKEKNTKATTLSLYAKKLGCLRKEASKPLLKLSVKEAMELAVTFSKRGDGSLVGTIAGMFFRFHDRQDLADAFKIKQSFKRLSPKEILTLDEVNDIMDVGGDLRDKALIALLWETGCRIHEALSLDLKDVSDFKNSAEKSFLKVFFRKVKIEGEEHSSPLIESTDHVRAWIKSYPYLKTAKSPLFTTSAGRRLTYAGASYLLRELLKRAGMENRKITLHTFRHSRATHMLRMHVPEAIIKKNLGWVPNSQMLARYSHLTDADVDDAILHMHGHESREPPNAGGLVKVVGDLPPLKTPIVFDGGPLEERLIEMEKTFEKKLEELFERNWVMPKDKSLAPLWMPVKIDSEDAVGKCTKCNVGYTEIQRRQFSECQRCGNPIQWDDMAD